MSFGKQFYTVLAAVYASYFPSREGDAAAPGWLFFTGLKASLLVVHNLFVFLEGSNGGSRTP